MDSWLLIVFLRPEPPGVLFIYQDSASYITNALMKCLLPVYSSCTFQIIFAMLCIVLSFHTNMQSKGLWNHTWVYPVNVLTSSDGERWSASPRSRERWQLNQELLKLYWFTCFKCARFKALCFHVNYYFLLRMSKWRSTQLSLACHVCCVALHMTHMRSCLIPLHERCGPELFTLGPQLKKDVLVTQFLSSPQLQKKKQMGMFWNFNETRHL